MTARQRITPLDLSLGALEQIERWAGVGVQDWPVGVASIPGLYGRMYAAKSGRGYEDDVALNVTFGELLELVGLGDDEEEDAATADADPTPAGRRR